jgi:signal transduction histidine kinase
MRSDVVLAVVIGVPLAALTTVAAALSVPGPRAVALIAAAVVAHVALAFRRTRPLLSHGVICAAFAGMAAITGLFLVLPSVLVFPISLFACTAYGRRWLPLATGVIGAAAVTLRFRYDDSVQAAGLLPNTWLLFALLLALVAASWSMGLFRRTQLAYTRLLEDQADQVAALAASDERTRIAREMHDVVAHSLSVMVSQAKGGQYAPERAGETLAVIESTGRQALTDMRGLLGVLRSGPDKESGKAPQPTLAGLPELLDRVGLPVELTVHGEPGTLSPAAELTAYRIVQEALTNVIKHADSAATTVSLSWSSADLLVEIVDEGNDAGELSDQGHGLAGMRERVAAIGGTVTAGPQPGGGFRVEARIPVER